MDCTAESWADDVRAFDHDLILYTLMPAITALICTYNGAADLPDLFDSLLDQADPPAYEIVVVDNNSDDSTESVVRDYAAQFTKTPVRYKHEARPGKSHALNTGLAASSGQWIADLDDDLILTRDYLATLKRSIQQHTSASFIGGKVLPRWQESGPPPWVTTDRWSPIGIADYGDEPFVVDSETRICLLASTYRTDALLSVGGFRPDISVAPDAVGGLEDADLFERLWDEGHHGVYCPDLEMYHKVPSRRLTRSYYRRWYLGHGKMLARQRSPEFEESSFRVFDIPGHVFRSLPSHLLTIASSLLRGEPDRAFDHELRARELLGYIEERLLP